MRPEASVERGPATQENIENATRARKLTLTSESQQELVPNIVITQQPEHRVLPGERVEHFVNEEDGTMSQ